MAGFGDVVVPLVVVVCLVEADTDED